jgi:glycosyltransferase involved in cell wall biosynthesis
VTKRTRLAIVVSHPIQHFVFFYRAIAAQEDIDLTVLFVAPIGVKAYFDREMQTQIAWKGDLLSGYQHKFLEPDKGDRQPGFFAPDATKLAAELDRLRPDAVLVYGYAQINAFRALEWCLRNHVPAIMTGDSELLRPRSAMISAAKRFLLPLILRRYCAFLGVGDRNEQFWQHYGIPSERIFRSPFTIDEASYRAAIADRTRLRAQVRAEFGIPDDATVALFVGKLSARKRPADLIEAAALASRQSGRQVIALLAGNGEEMQILQSRVEAESLPARLAGFVNLDRLPGLFAASEIFAHPSAADPHPLVCSEAAIMGLPMVISDRVGAVGPTDIAREGANTLVYPVGDVQAMANAIAAIASDPELAARMAEKSRSIFGELDINRSVSGLKAALARALPEHSHLDDGQLPA